MTTTPNHKPSTDEDVPHYALPPAHRCRNCQRPWPCPEAQMNLVTEFYGDPVGLAVYLGRMYEVAIADRTALGLTVDPAPMYQRYLGWIRMARRPTRH